MDFSPDPLQAQLRRALRAGLASVTDRPAVRGTPVGDGQDSPASELLGELGLSLYELPVTAGGLDLGLAAGVTISEELGRAACGNPYRAGAFAADAAVASGRTDVLDRLLGGATVAAAGLEALPSGSAVQVRRSDGGWELSGAVTVDAAGADMVAVLARVREAPAPALALLPAGSAGIKWHVGRWPYVVELTDVPVAQTDLLHQVETPGGGSLARARVRQAAYLLGLAGGMHEAAVKYTGTRRQFGGTLRELQAVSLPLARAVVALRVTRMLVHRAVWLADTGQPSTAPAEALAAAAETLADISRLTMQACGSRSMTSQLPLHRYYRLAAVEPVRYGRPVALWRLVGADAIAGYGADGKLPA